MYPEDEVTLASAEGEFEDKYAGEGKTVFITGVMLDGADARNYVLPEEPFQTKADIEPRTVCVEGVSIEEKPYDGTTAAKLANPGALVGVLDGDEVRLDAEHASAAFADAEPGSGKTVMVTGLRLTGPDARNYRLAPVTAVGNITAPPPSAEKPEEEPSEEPQGEPSEPPVEPPTQPGSREPAAPVPSQPGTPVDGGGDLIADARGEEGAGQTAVGALVPWAGSGMPEAPMYQGELLLDDVPVQVSARDGRVVLTLPDAEATGPERPASQGSVSLFVQNAEGIEPLRSVSVTAQGNELSLAPAEAAAGAAPPEIADLTLLDQILLELPDGRVVELEVSVAADGAVWVTGAGEAREALGEEVIALIVLSVIERRLGRTAESVRAIVLR